MNIEVESIEKEPVNIAEGIFWVGYSDENRGLHCNPYLIIEGNEAVLIDGGNRNDFSTVMLKILRTGLEPSQITRLIYQHYDPDLCGSLPQLETIIRNDSLRIISHAENLAEIAYPKNLSDKIDRIILNLYRINPSYGYTFCMDASIARAFFAETAQEEECIGIAYLMEELEYLFQANDGGYRIAAKGWQRIDELLRQSSEKRQAFIAMAFKQETQKIREAFKKSIVAAGYTPLAIDEKEHNNQIVPEIFDEIGKSSFLVMDVTEPNYGAYYEAGYALGKGKQVIICCQEAAFKNFDSRPHFDIAQKSMIVWQTEEELVERLKKRIIATMK